MVSRIKNKIRRATPALAGVAAVFLSAGCEALGDRTTLSNFRVQARSLQAENDRLTESSTRLRAENQDMSERALDDARRISRLEADIHRLEQSVLAYQQDRERLAADFAKLKRGLAVSADDLDTPSRQAADPAASTTSGSRTARIEDGSN